MSKSLNYNDLLGFCLEKDKRSIHHWIRECLPLARYQESVRQDVEERIIEANGHHPLFTITLKEVLRLSGNVKCIWCQNTGWEEKETPFTNEIYKTSYEPQLETPCNSCGRDAYKEGYGEGK